MINAAKREGAKISKFYYFQYTMLQNLGNLDWLVCKFLIQYFKHFRKYVGLGYDMHLLQLFFKELEKTM